MNVEESLKEFSISSTREPEHFRVLCPYHQDTNPSLTIHHKTGVCRCWVCRKTTTLCSYLARVSNFTLAQVKLKLGTKSDCRHPIAATEVERFHIDIWKHPELLAGLRHRCVTDDLIRKYRYGCIAYGTEYRVSIPILNDVEEYACIRSYIPGASGRKFLNFGGKDSAKIRWYPVEQLEYDQVLICPGEVKAIVAAEILNKYDIGAIAPTCGEGTILPQHLVERLTGKLLYVIGDTDKPGQECLESRCRQLKSHARELHKVEIPAPIESVKLDVNDFVRDGGDLYALLCNSPEWEFIPGGTLPEDIPQDITFRQAFQREYVGKRVRTTAIISGISSSSYNVPSIVEVQCHRDQDYCLTCDVNNQAYSHNTEMAINPEHRMILALIQEKDLHHPYIYKECFHIPKKCDQCNFVRKQEYSVDEILMDEQLDATSREIPVTKKMGYLINGPQSIENQSYQVTGRLHPSPKNQMSVFLASKCEPTADSLEAYHPAENGELSIFTPTEWTLESLQEKMDDIYNDFEANVTRIWRRRDMHIAIDLVYHSLLHFNFHGQENLKGWLELLVVGDTREGKTETFEKLQQHYGLGVKVNCEHLTKAGLTIGLDGKGHRWFAVYGVMPQNDKKLVCLEELSGMRTEIFQSLTEVRSSGRIQTNKIERGDRMARVRLIALSNPPGEREINNYTFGVECALHLIGTNQDLSRFDLVLVIGKSDIPELPERENPPVYPHKYPADLCMKLVLKAWKCEKAVFLDPLYVIAKTKILQAKFGDGPPILDPHSSHIKIARLAAALAARTNSYEENTLVVRNCHVEFIAEFLDRIYSSPSCKLNEKSRLVRENACIRGKPELIQYLKTIPGIQDIILKIQDADIITAMYVRDLVGDFYLGSTLFARLVQANALTITRAGKYVKTAEFVALIKSGVFSMIVPKYITDRRDEEKF